MTTDPGELVILATLTDAGGQPTPLLIDGYVLPVIVHVKVQRRSSRGRVLFGGAWPRLVHLRLGPACLHPRLPWASSPFA